MEINPDIFLQTENGRVINAELNRRAWARCMDALRKAMADRSPNTILFLLIGAQGAGKTTWIRSQKKNIGPDAVIFDAILVTKAERKPLLEIARESSVPAIAIWMDTPLSLCLERNAGRAQDEVVPEQAVKNVHAALEPPTVDEGFSFVHRFHAGESCLLGG